MLVHVSKPMWNGIEQIYFFNQVQAFYRPLKWKLFIFPSIWYRINAKDAPMGPQFSVFAQAGPVISTKAILRPGIG